jgi:hypothetical protein
VTTLETLTGLQFRIQPTHGAPPEQLLVDSDRVLIGSGAHCEVRLPGDQAAAEHVLITFNGGAVIATARALNPPPMLNGTPFTEAPLRPDSVLQIGRAEITISIVEIGDKQNVSVTNKKKEGMSPVTYVLALLAIPLLIFILLDDRKPGLAAGMPAEAPALWDAAAAQTCPQRSPDQAAAIAREKKVQAEGKRERSPFDVVDGVSAVPLFEVAADCFKVAGDEARSREMVTAGTKLRAQLDEDYRAHRMRLQHAIDIKEMSTVQREVKVILAMLRGQTGAYVVWLSNLDRQLKLQGIEKDKKKNKK